MLTSAVKMQTFVGKGDVKTILVATTANVLRVTNQTLKQICALVRAKFLFVKSNYFEQINIPVIQYFFSSCAGSINRLSNRTDTAVSHSNGTQVKVRSDWVVILEL